MLKRLVFMACWVWKPGSKCSSQRDGGIGLPQKLRCGGLCIHRVFMKTLRTAVISPKEIRRELPRGRRKFLRALGKAPSRLHPNASFGSADGCGMESHYETTCNVSIAQMEMSVRREYCAWALVGMMCVKCTYKFGKLGLLYDVELNVHTTPPAWPPHPTPA